MGDPTPLCVWGQASRAVLWAGSWGPGSNISVHCTLNSMSLISYSEKTAFCHFHTSLQVHVPSLAQAIPIISLSVTKEGNLYSGTLQGWGFYGRYRWGSQLFAKYGILIFSKMYSACQVELGQLFATWLCEDLNNIVGSCFSYWSWFCSAFQLGLPVVFLFALSWEKLISAKNFICASSLFSHQ